MPHLLWLLGMLYIGLFTANQRTIKDAYYCLKLESYDRKLVARERLPQQQRLQVILVQLLGLGLSLLLLFVIAMGLSPK